MQKTVYKCDQCDHEMGNKTHISLRLGSDSGIFEAPSKTRKYWHYKVQLDNKFMHFCNGRCLGNYFSGLMKKK